MNLLLVYLLVFVLWGMRSARREQRVGRWAPLLITCVVAVGYLSRRII